jgi:hypothetical protein
MCAYNRIRLDGCGIGASKLVSGDYQQGEKQQKKSVFFWIKSGPVRLVLP